MKRIAKSFFIPIQLIILYFFDYIYKFNSKKKYSFTIGTHEIANCLHDLSKVFKNESVSVSFSLNKFYRNNSYDYSISISNKYLFHMIKLFYGPYLLAKLSNQSNVFIYFWWDGFCLDREIDYKFLKGKGIKIVTIFLGTDIRSHKLTLDYHKKNMFDVGSNYILQNIEASEERVKRVAYLADKYSDLIFNHPKDQMCYLKSKQLLMPYMYQLSKMCSNKDKFINMNMIKIVHASSNPIIKGTPLIRAAIAKLRNEGYTFEYTELFNTPNSEVLDILSKSHILLNEFYAFVPGVLAIEAMANHNATITSAEYEGFPNGASNAWFETKYWEVYDNLKYLLDNPAKIKEYADNGYEYVKNNYTEDNVREFYINTFYENNIIDDKNVF